jgi:hypothetical protein
MSAEMRSFMEAYQAVHNKVTDGDLCEIAEEVLEVMFADGKGVADCEAIVESILTSSTNPGRQAKIERLQESFKKVFGTVKEKSARTAVESYALYRKGKSLQDNWSRKFSHENGNVRLHNSLVAEDRAGVKNGLLELYKGKHGQEEYVDEAEKPFPYEKVKKKQVSLRDKGGNALDRRMQMGAAVRRAKEAEKSGGSQRDAGKGWYHAKEEYVDEADSIAAMRERAAEDSSVMVSLVAVVVMISDHTPKQTMREVKRKLPRKK